MEARTVPEHGTETGWLQDRSAPEADDAVRRFFDMSLDLFVVLDDQARFQKTNAQWHAALGWHEDELRGRLMLAFVHPEDRRRADEALADLEQPGSQNEHIDVRFRDASGGYRWLAWTLTRDATRGLYLGVARDHTNQRDLEELSKAIVEDVQDYAIFMLDRSGHVRTWNRGAERIKGYSATEAIGLHFSSFYPPDQQERPLRLMRIAEREGRAEDEGWRVRKDGTRFWANVVITAVRDANGRILGFTKLTRDLTERRRKEEAERRNFEQDLNLRHYEQLSRMRADLLNLVAHELRTPLTPLRVQVQMLRAGRLGALAPGQQDAIAVLDRNITRLAHLVQDVLEVSRLEAGKVAIRPQAVSLDGLLAEARQTYEAAAAMKGVSFELDAADGLQVWGDPDRLLQVLYNLVDNALKFTPDGGRVIVRATEGEEVLVEVEDTGAGLTKAQSKRLFEPFVQVHDNARTGTGLGLYIARQIVERHGGAIGCRSDGEGRGSVFWFRLPRPAQL